MPSSIKETPVSAPPVQTPLPSPLAQLCLALESYRRTDDGRVRSARDLVAHFFPYDASSAEDRVLRHLPREVRGPILSAWGLRGTKTALRDDDAKVRSVVHDALVAGDIDPAAFEEGIDAEALVGHVPLASWWAFWRGADLTKNALRKALVTAHDLSLFDAAWLWETITRGDLRGTDVVADALSKAELGDWLRAVHRSGDGSAAGFLAAIGWERLVTRTPNDALLRVVDALAEKVGLVTPASEHAADAASASDAIDASDSATSADESGQVDAMFDALMTPEGSVDAPRPPDSVIAVLLTDEEDEDTIPPQPRPDLLLAPPAPISSPTLATSPQIRDFFR
jgi:hypothetical protein